MVQSDLDRRGCELGHEALSHRKRVWLDRDSDRVVDGDVTRQKACLSVLCGIKAANEAMHHPPHGSGCRRGTGSVVLRKQVEPHIGEASSHLLALIGRHGPHLSAEAHSVLFLEIKQAVPLAKEVEMHICEVLGLLLVEIRDRRPLGQHVAGLPRGADAFDIA